MKPKPDPQPRQVDLTVRELLDNIRSCWFATASVINHDRKKDEQFEERCYRDLFKLVTGRKPTREEMDHMTGGQDMTKEKKS